MKIGIAVTTFSRPLHIQEWTKRAAETSPEDAVFHIANDTKDRKGVAFRKTECIRELYNAGCDVMFVFDDDTFPIKKGWTEFFIEALRVSGQNHFCFMIEGPGTKCIGSKGWQYDVGVHEFDDGPCIEIFDNCNGCLMVLTRKAVEAVGAFNPNYKMYGFEHADYTNRIHAAGLNPMGRYLCPAGASEYIYACDLDNSQPEIQKRLKHKSSMHPREALHHAQKAHEVFRKPSQIYYPL